MAEKDMMALARKYCEYCHEGQFRGGSNLPYATHPVAVASILEKYGYNDVVTQCIALLHDTIEDSQIRMDEIQDVFGYEISNGVFILSKNKGKIKGQDKLSPEDYIKRLYWARRTIRRVKIADMIHNTTDLDSLSPEGIRKKLVEAVETYIPWGKEIAPIMVEELISNVESYKRKILS